MVIKAERLDRLIDIERKTLGESPSGEPTETWAKIATNLAASYSSIRGDERSQAAQFVAKEQVEFWVRWSDVAKTISPLDRVIYPAGSTNARDVYDIMYAPEVGREDGIKIAAARRADV
jgi:SPP1 family predicted phage head-tail adaptor